MRDALILIGVAVVIYALAYHYNVHDRLRDWLMETEGYQLDEALLALTFCGIGGFVFALRRLLDLRREVVRRRRIEDEAHRLARHDMLTGLPNRRRFIEEFPAWAEHVAPGGFLAVLLVDLDHFKPVNDLYGHRLGDEVLRVISARLTRVIGNRGMVARLGGDEFGIVAQFHSADEAIGMARRIVNEIPRPIPLAALSIEVGVSLGVAVDNDETDFTDEMTPSDGSKIETLLRRADMAMYRAKTEGRGAYRFFDANMDERLRQRMQLEREIKRAIKNGEIVPYYQPLVHLASNRVIGYEVLARWEHPTRGLLSPNLFVPIAEDTGVIGPLTYELLQRAIRDAKTWPSDLRIAINLSPRQFADTFLSQKIRGILAAEGFPAHRLEIEITETAMVQRMDEAKALLNRLRDLGIRIALDDFGVGYSGLYHLRELRPDTLKIDRSFVSRMLEETEECRLVEAMIQLGHALGMKTTAEGIETKAMLDRLLALGCEYGQGYLFGRPTPAPAVYEQSETRRIA